MSPTYRRMERERKRRLTPEEMAAEPGERSAERRMSIDDVVAGAASGAETATQEMVSLQRAAGNRSVVGMLQRPARTTSGPDGFKQVAKGPDPKIDLPVQRGEKKGGPKRKEGGAKEKGGFWSKAFGGGSRQNQVQAPPNNDPVAPPQPAVIPAAVRPTGPAATSVVRQAPGPNTKKTAKGAWGCVDTETVTPTLTATSVGEKWAFDATAFQGNYGKIVTLVKGCREVTGADPDDDISSDQIYDLWQLGDFRGKWYMLQAVEAHESVHESRVDPALAAVSAQLQTDFAKLEVKKSKTVKDPASALQALQASGKYKQTCKRAREIWDAKYVQLIQNDHAALTPAAEHAVVDPMIRQINRERVANGLTEWWPSGWTG